MLCSSWFLIALIILLLIVFLVNGFILVLPLVLTIVLGLALATTLAPPPSAYFVALEFPGTSPNFYYSSPLWTNTALHNVAVSGGTERKTSDFFTAASVVKLEIEQRSGTTTSVELPLAQSASLHQIFNGGYLATNGARAEWRALSGYGYQQNCNRQGFNIRGQTPWSSSATKRMTSSIAEQ